VYKITAQWGNNEYEYAFVIKNKDDIGKDDITLFDKTGNINVMLIRPANWRKIIDAPVISEKEMKLIDGSTATIPITAELFRQFFDYSDEKLNEMYVAYYHSTTHYAYINLIERQSAWSLGTPNTSLIFVTPPSEEEKQMAAKAGIELDIVPIAKDGFVFIVHKDNPVESLTPEQIRAIYAGEITNWKEVGGEDIEIRAYQREPNSGSQTAMEQMVMQGRQMIAPIDTQVIGGMGELVDAVAEYENGRASIGYTYYYYINNLYKNENIKVLRINGITPDNENLTDETYPFTTNYYAVMRSDEAEGSPAMILREFLISEPGQQLIEMAGYCRVAE
jgi:phosphate transport system substrate-binding protein